MSIHSSFVLPNIDVTRIFKNLENSDIFEFFNFLNREILEF